MKVAFSHTLGWSEISRNQYSRRFFFIFWSSVTVAAFLFLSQSVSAQTVAEQKLDASDSITDTDTQGSEDGDTAEDDGEVDVAFDNAEDEGEQGEDTEDDEGEEGENEENLGEEEIAPEVLLDELVTHENLGATKSRILPDSPLHAVKRFGWGVQEAFTFDVVKDTELKLQHTNQHLAEVKQLVDEKGFNAVDPELLAHECKRFQDKFAKVAKQAEKLKGLNSETVNQVLSDVTNKQIQQQKVLNVIAKEAIAVKKEAIATGDQIEAEAEAMDALLGTVQTVKQETVKNFTKAVTTVIEDPEAVSTLVTDALESSVGSELKGLKHLEFLEAMSENAPESAQAAITLAKRKTAEHFETSVKALPPASRAETFKRYIEHATSEETRLMKLLEEIKQTTNIPPEVLAKIEEAKEITVRKFELKLQLIDDADVRHQFIENLPSDSVADIVAIEDIKSRMRGEGANKDFFDEFHAGALQGFRDRFTDVDSENQAALFEKLSLEMARNPSPKTFKLVRELEQHVLSNPEKSAFLNTMEEDMKKRVEERYQREGDLFTERFASLDPDDIGVVEVIAFDPALKEKMIAKKADKMQAYMRDIAEPEQFDRFYERFYHAPPVVIDQIRNAAPDFQSAVQFKVRKMEERRLEKEREIARASLDFQERELRHQIDRTQRKQDDDFWQKFNQVPWEKFDERKSLWDSKINDSLAVTQERYEEQKRIFDTRLKLDPFCDDICRTIQTQFLEQEVRHEKERLGDDLRRERNRIEGDKAQYQKNNPLAANCTTSESCEAYCLQNRTLPECQWVVIEETVSCAPGSYWDSTIQSCVSDIAVASACEPGTYYDAFSKGCQKDPYYVPPREFVNCGPGSFWNAARGFCEQENRCQSTYTLTGVSYTGDCYTGGDHLCPKGFFWDGGRNECVQDGFTKCPPSFYFDFGLKRCEPDRRSQCGPEQYWDGVLCVAIHKNICPEASFSTLPPCPPGSYREPKQDANGCWVPGECKVTKNICPKEPFPCAAGLVRNVGLRSDGCPDYGSCQPLICPAVMPRTCAPDEKPTPPAPGDYCGLSSCIPPIDQICLVYDPKPCGPSEYRDWKTNEKGCSVPGLCVAQGGEQVFYTFSDGYKAKSFEDAVAHCKAYGPGSGAGIAATCEAKFGVVYEKKIFCGNGICESGETTASCTSDCGFAPVGYCGDKICNGAETAISCGSDCGGAVSSCPATKYNNNTAGSNSCNYSICPNGCTYNSQNCPSDCYDPNYQCQKTVATGSSLSAWSCSSTCTNGCNYDTKGCATSCLSDADKCKNVFGYHYDSATKTCVKDNVTCSNPKACDACPSGTTGSWCNNDYNGCPTGCQKSTYCGDKVCDAGESSWCSSDCGSTVTTCDKDNICEPNNGETTGTCPSDCSSITACDKDGVCEYGESVGSCPSDCGSTEKVCGDKFCNGTETAISCPTDCGGTASCTSNKYNYYTSGFSCDTAFCPGGCTKDAKGCATGCSGPENVAKCGDAICQSTESSTSCPSDCGGTSSCSTTPASCKTEAECAGAKYYWCNGYCYATSASCPTSTVCPSNEYNNYTTGTTCNATKCTSGCTLDTKGCPIACNTAASKCGNAICEATESNVSCPQDCGSGTAKCGNGICDSGETGAGCPADCGSKCSSTPSACYTQTECTYSGFYWCNGVCQSATCTTTDCSSASNCYVQSTCTSKGWYWCNGGCWTTASSCPATGTCGDKICGSSETSASCPADCGTTGSGCNYNNVCDSGETTASCASDCKSTTTSCPSNSYTKIENNAVMCNYTTCPSGCNWSGSCPTSCSPSTSGYCGDKICQSGESASTCSSDCGTSSTCNYNNICDGSETTATCASDCKTVCSSNEYNNYTTGTTCSYSKCPSGCNYNSQGCPTSCYTSPTGYCGDKICQSTESSSSCATDCGSTPPIICNGNGVCDGSETTANCPADCKAAAVCGNGTCESGETTSSCTSDCGPPPAPKCPENTYTNNTGGCNYTTCPSGCNWSSASPSCPSGCYTPPPPPAVGYCGDKACNNGETSASCPGDCGTATPTTGCGNNICDSGETHTTCPADCHTVGFLGTKNALALSDMSPVDRLSLSLRSFFGQFFGTARAALWYWWR